MAITAPNLKPRVETSSIRPGDAGGPLAPGYNPGDMVLYFASGVIEVWQAFFDGTNVKWVQILPAGPPGLFLDLGGQAVGASAGAVVVTTFATASETSTAMNAGVLACSFNYTGAVDPDPASGTFAYGILQLPRIDKLVYPQQIVVKNNGDTLGVAGFGPFALSIHRAAGFAVPPSIDTLPSTWPQGGAVPSPTVITSANYVILAPGDSIRLLSVPGSGVYYIIS